MGRKRTGRIITIVGIGAIAVLVAFMVALQVGAARNNEFKKSIDEIAVDTIALTQEYKEEEDKWLESPDNYDNSTMTPIFNQYHLRYQQLIERAEALDTPDRYKTAKAFLIESIEFEMLSNRHFLNYLITEDQAEYEKAAEFAQNSHDISGQYDAAMKAAG
jgi:glutamine cyclotransferase